MRKTSAKLLRALMLFTTLAAAAPAVDEIPLTELLRNPAAYDGHQITTSGFIKANGDDGASIHPTASMARDDDYSRWIAIRSRSDDIGAFRDGRAARVSGVFEVDGFGDVNQIHYGIVDALLSTDDRAHPDPVWWLSPTYAAIFSILLAVCGAIGFRAWSSVMASSPTGSTHIGRRFPSRRHRH